jgi:putative ABC transport system ATP-binding protein
VQQTPETPLEEPAPAGAAPAVAYRTVGLTKVYQMEESEVWALRGVDLELYAGQTVVLLGPSGSGKSSFLNILGGLDRPTDGQVFFFGDELTEFDDAALTEYRRERVGFVFQFYNLIPSLTARENVELVTEIAEAGLDAAEALGLVGLAERMDHFPAELSGGEQQRIAVARAIAKRPDVLLCDEPTGALDSQTGIGVLETIENVNRELGTTTVLITHNAGIAAMADRVVHFADGRVAEIKENATKSAARDLSW